MPPATDELTFDLADVWRVFRRSWWVIALAVLVAAGTAATVSAWAIPPVYRATATAIVLRPEASGPDAGTLSLNRQLTNTFVRLGISRGVLAAAGKRFSPAIDAEILRSRVQVAALAGTELVEIRAEAHRPEEAAALANAVAAALGAEVQRLYRVDLFQLLDPARPPAAPIRPNVLLNVAVAAMLGAMGGAGLAFLREALDNRLRTEADVERLLGVPCLGAVPEVRPRNRRLPLEIIEPPVAFTRRPALARPTLTYPRVVDRAAGAR